MDPVRAARPATTSQPIPWGRMVEYRLEIVGVISDPPGLAGFLAASFRAGDDSLTFLLGAN